MTRMIIDTDPGIDDAMAIHFAAADPDIDIVGLTTVFGNVYVPQASRNALQLLEMVGINAPVAEGASAPLDMPPETPPSHIHGAEGFGDLEAGQPTTHKLDITAAEFLVKTCAESPGEITICAIGPLTNLALALRLAPSVARTVKKVVIMGGAVETAGNITPFAEANIYHDPQAAADVFAAAWPVVLVGLDVTHDIICTKDNFATIAKNAPKIGGFIQDISNFYLNFYDSIGKYEGCSLHDPAAIIAATNPELFQIKSTPLRVITSGERQGQTIADDTANTPSVDVCIGVNSAVVKDRFIEMFRNLD